MQDSPACSAARSFEAAVRDVDAVLAARGVDRALLVGWSYGAVVAAHWAARNPSRTVGAVPVDGAFPYDWLDEATEQPIRKLFRRLRVVAPVPRMTAEQQAESNINSCPGRRAGSPALISLTRPTPDATRAGSRPAS